MYLGRSTRFRDKNSFPLFFVGEKALVGIYLNRYFF